MHYFLKPLQQVFLVVVYCLLYFWWSCFSATQSASHLPACSLLFSMFNMQIRGKNLRSMGILFPLKQICICAGGQGLNRLDDLKLSGIEIRSLTSIPANVFPPHIKGFYEFLFFNKFFIFIPVNFSEFTSASLPLSHFFCNWQIPLQEHQN